MYVFMYVCMYVSIYLYIHPSIHSSIHASTHFPHIDPFIHSLKTYHYLQLPIFISLHQKYLLQHSDITNSLINEGISLLTKEDSIETTRKMNQWCNNLYLLTTTSNHIRLLIIINIIIVVTIISTMIAW